MLQVQMLRVIQNLSMEYTLPHCIENIKFTSYEPLGKIYLDKAIGWVGVNLDFHIIGDFWQVDGLTASHDPVII